MKYTSLFLILTVILCSVGLDVDAYHSYTFIADSHTNHNETSGTESIANSYKSMETASREMCICDHALPNAPYGYNFSLRGIYSAAVSVTISEINRVSESSLSLLDLREYHAPDVFISNSSLLL